VNGIVARRSPNNEIICYDAPLIRFCFNGHKLSSVYPTCYFNEQNYMLNELNDEELYTKLKTVFPNLTAPQPQI